MKEHYFMVTFIKKGITKKFKMLLLNFSDSVNSKEIFNGTYATYARFGMEVVKVENA